MQNDAHLIWSNKVKRNEAQCSHNGCSSKDDADTSTARSANNGQPDERVGTTAGVSENNNQDALVTQAQGRDQIVKNVIIWS